MKTAICMFFVLITAMAHAAPPAEPAPKPASNTVAAERELRLAPSGVMRTEFGADGYGALWRLDLGGIVGKVIGVSTDEAKGLVKSSEQVPQEGMFKIAIDLHQSPAGAKMLATEAADAVVAAMQSKLDEVSNDHFGVQLDQANRELTRANDQYQELLARLENSRAKIREQSGAIDVSPATIRQLLSSLQNQYESVQIDLTAKAARRDALAEQIAKYSKEMEEKIKDDQVAAELEKIVAIRQQDLEVKKKMYDAATVAQSEVNSAISAIAEAKAKLLERREAATAAAGGDILPAWNRELMNLSVDLAELRARDDAISKRMSQFKDVDRLLNEYEQAQQQLAIVTKSLAAARQDLDARQAEKESGALKLKVIDSKDVPAPAK
jgi:DNA repair exonuclease SbcCD ATPase subunit